MKQILTIIGILLTTILSAQNCTVCPNSNVQLTSSYPPTATHSWSCSNGFTSSLQNPVMPVGTTNVNCTLLVTQGGCVSTSTTNVTVLAGGPTATLTANRCQILLSGTTCGTVKLQRSLDGTTGWTDYITNPTFPYSVTQSYWWRIKMVCPCGTFYSNAVYIYYTTGVINSDCLILLPGWNSYTCNTWDIYKSCDNGATWTLWQSNNTSGFTFADADCCFRWVCAASTGLNNYCANDLCIVGENCNIGCNAAIGVGQAGCTMNITWVSCAGTWAIQKLIGSTWTNVASGTSPGPSSYTITSNGQYRAIQTCNSPLCNYQSVTLNFTTCGGPCTPLPSVTISQSPTPCTSTASLTANVSNCNGTATYSWSNGANTQTISGVSTGTYTVTVSGCCASTSTSYTLTCTPPNPCTGFSANITGTFTGLCVGSSYTYNRTITGGTAPFTQQWKVNGVNVGTGTSYTYTPTSAGTYTLTVTVTDANNCSYTDTKTLTVINCCGMTVSLSPDITVCVNQSGTFTATPTGGAAPIGYSWTSQLPPASPVAQGSGNPKSFTFGTAGTYTIQVTATDANGCTAQASRNMVVQNCTNCTCTPTLVLNGCVLNGEFTGAGCGNFNYQLQYSATGSGWTAVLSGASTPGGTITYNPVANGFYRLVIVGNGGSGCTGTETSIVSVTCFVPTCTNSPTLTLNGTISQTCGTAPVTVSGNTFGGSATSVTITENGAGTVSPTSSGSSPFAFTYTPAAGDIGTTVTVTVTTNNPLGSPCVSAVGQYSIQVNAIPQPVITPVSPICVNQTVSLSATPAGGTYSVTGTGTLSGNSILATGAGNIVVTYSVTTNGCTGTSQQTIVSNALPSTPVASVVCSGGLGTLTVTSPTGAGLEYSINNTTWQSSNIFTGLTNNSYTVYVRNANGCVSSTTVQVNCSTCGCTASIAITTDCTMSLTQACTGYAWTWQESLNGTSGWAAVQTNGSTYSGVSGRFYRVVLTKATCSDVTTNILNPLCPCMGLSMSITPVTGGLSFGTLNYNGVPLTNYQIQWRRCSDNSVVITSGMGTGSGSGIFPHPSSNVPVVGDCYYAFIVFSPQGNNLDCFPDVNVANWTCANPPNYSYDGPGGAAATREFRMDISASTNIRIGYFSTLTIPDNLEVIYNGVTLYNSSNQILLSSTPIVIPIVYVTGVNYVTFRVTNSLPSSNTIWQLSNVSCCNTIICPTIANVPQVTSISTSINSSCQCTFNFTYSPYNLTCSGCSDPIKSNSTSVGGCGLAFSYNDGVCKNETVVITKLSGASKSFDFATSTNYNIVKNAIIATTGDDLLTIQFHTQTCGNDGALYTYNLFPTYHTITYDDVNFIITITVSATNPFVNNCTNCNSSKRTQYDLIYNYFNTTSATGTVLSIRNISRYFYSANAVIPRDFTSIIYCTGGSCGANLDRRYRLSYRNTNCPCQSWELHEDTDDNGTYETLVLQAPGWTGTCL